MITTDTYSALTSATSPSRTYNFSQTGIAWPGEAKKYATTPGYNVSQIVPPPNWQKYSGGYNESNLPDLKSDEHFQNWMRTAGLPTFSKLYGRNDDTTLEKDRYTIIVDLSALLSISVPELNADKPNYRLSCHLVWRYKVHCHLDGVLDWREEPVPGMGIRSCCGTACCPCYPRDNPAYGSPKVSSRYIIDA